MANINLLPWREERRELRKKQFIVFSVVSALLAMVAVAMLWMFYNHKLDDQEQANQLIISSNQNLDQQLKSLQGLQERRNAIVERMKLIQGLEGQRPVTVRLVDELVRVVPAQMYLTKFARTGDKFTIEGRAENPNVVAELLRNLEASAWYRNAFMNSFLAADDKKTQPQGSVIPRIEETYGTFVVTADLGEIGVIADGTDKNAQTQQMGVKK